eukprot:253133_1
MQSTWLNIVTLIIHVLIHSNIGLMGHLIEPKSLQVNHIDAYEPSSFTNYSTKYHIPMIELIDANSRVKLPTFSWILHSNHSLYFNDSQQYYQLQIHDHINQHLIYESSKIKTSETVANLNQYEDKIKLNISSLLYPYIWKTVSFRVRWYSKYEPETASNWSDYAEFILTSSFMPDWNNATYIAKKSVYNNEFNERSPMFRKIFNTSTQKSIQSAIISIIGLGFFRLYINDIDSLSSFTPPIMQVPGFTNWNYRVPYVTLDVTDCIKNNNLNDMILLLGIGYRNQTAYYRHESAPPSDIIDCVLKLQLILTYTDNSTQIIISDGSWKTALSPIIRSSIYNGEIYDDNLRKLNTNYYNWQNVLVLQLPYSGPSGILFPSVQPFVSILNSYAPINVYNTVDRNSQIVDFGLNMAGLIRINVSLLNPGDVLQMKFAEIKQHEPYGEPNGNLDYRNLRTALAYDTFIASDNRYDDFYQPLFTIHGFRYVEIWGYPRPITSHDIIKLDIAANLKRITQWNSSDIQLNIINENCIRTQYSNIQSIVTDCAQRDERLGWGADARIAADSHAVNFDMKSFFINEAYLWKDEQININNTSNLTTYGAISGQAPWISKPTYSSRPGDPNYSNAFVNYPYVLFKYYGITHISKEFMNNYSLYIESLNNILKLAPVNGDMAKYPCRFSDWVPPPPNLPINHSFVGTFAFIEAVVMVKDLAHAIGNDSYSQQLNTLYNDLKNQFIDTFWNDKTEKYLYKFNQSSCALALFNGMYYNNNSNKSPNKTILENTLIDGIRNIDKSLFTTGIIATKYMLQVLGEMNENALALYMIRGGNNSLYPSYSYMIGNNSKELEAPTTLWERWDSDNDINDTFTRMNSRNQDAFTTVSHYLTTFVSGLRIKNNNHKYYQVDIGHLKINELKWSRINMYDALLVYNWEWIDRYKLNVFLIAPVGYTVDIKFHFHDICHDWDIYNLPTNHIVLDYSKWRKLLQDSVMTVGSGHYSFQVACQ